MNRTTLSALATSLLLAVPASAQNVEPSTANALAKQLANPVASLVSVPFQMNFDRRRTGTSSRA